MSRSTSTASTPTTTASTTTASSPGKSSHHSSLKSHTSYANYMKLSSQVYRRVAFYSDTQSRRRLAQVSKSWRALVAPLLWETINIYDYCEVEAVAQHVHKHYGPHVKHINFQTRHGRRGIPTWLDSPSEVAIIGAWLEVQWPALQSMAVRFLFTPVDIRIIDLARNMPQLMTLTVDNSYLPWRDVAKWALSAGRINDLSVSYTSELGESDRRRFAHLLGDYNVLQGIQGDGFTRLRMQYQPDELGVFYASVLRTQPNLRELRIDRIPAAHVELLSKQLCYPSSVETLCLGIDADDTLPVLGCLNPRSLPKLSRLMIRCNSTPLAQCENVLNEFVSHEWPSLRGLITSVMTNAQCDQVVKACPNLEVLMVQPETPTERQIHNSGLEAVLKGLRNLRRLHVVQQISPVGEMLSDGFVWKATHYEPPKMLSLRKSRRWEHWAPKLASSPWVCSNLQELSLCGVYMTFPALVQLLATLPNLHSLKVCVRSGAVGTTITPGMFEPWGRHSLLRYLIVDDIQEADLPHLRRLCEFMPHIRHCRIASKTALPESFRSGSTLSLAKATSKSVAKSSTHGSAAGSARSIPV